MSWNERLFVVIPFLSVVCNVFLLLTVLTVKKDKLISAFIGLLVTFTAWSIGSLFLRMKLFPGPEFWYMISITGIFLVPFFIYNFVHRYTNAKGGFVRGVLLVTWLVISILNLSNVFVTDPKIVYDGVEWRFEYGISGWIVVPILLAVVTLCQAAALIIQNCKSGNVSLKQFTPMFFGVGVMFAGTMSAVLPQMVSLPIDTFSCGVNAVCLYYMLYKRRVVQLQGFTSDAPIYGVSLLCSVLLLVNVLDHIQALFQRYFPNFLEYQTIAIAVLLTVTTLLLHAIFCRLMEKVLLKGTEEQERSLREFSTAVNKVMKLDELLSLYCDFLQRNFPGVKARVFLKNQSTGSFCMKSATDIAIANRDSFTEDHPMVTWLKDHQEAASYETFCKSKNFRAMWSKEKKRLEEMQVEVILPVVSGEDLTAITLISSEQRDKKHSGIPLSGMAFLESAAAVFSMALNNTALYEELRRKAQRDPLTNLYNRGYFQENIAKEFELSRHSQITLLLINLDDFRLYNELYGMAEGDLVLKRFAETLKTLVRGRGTVARYGGKEFVVSFPMCPPSAAVDCAQHAKEWMTKEILYSGGKTKKFLTFSAGISSYPANAGNVHELFTYANMAVYSAKNNGKNRIVVYQREDKDEAMAKSLKSKRALAESCASTIYALTAAIDAKDHYTFNHSNNVAEYAAILAEELGLDAEHVEIIRQAGMLHDIGKIGTPEAILSKKDRLTRDEYEIMKQHVEGSISMIKYLPSLDYVVPSVLGHHERWDGGGYPRGLAGKAIPVGARCLCLADSFDAMVSKRSYKDAMSVEQAVQEIRRNLGTQFDPEIGQLFITLVESGKIPVARSGRLNDYQ